ncbi:MAG: hypothetical protein WC454_03085 [Phycisphaerae bacterium]|jgi:hypothetical protein
MYIRERASARTANEPILVDWAKTADIVKIMNLLSSGSGGDKFRAYGVFDTFDDVKFQLVSKHILFQPVVNGTETGTIEDYLVASLVSAIRDYIDYDSGVDAVCDGVRVVIMVGERSSGLRKAMRRKIRHTLDSERWRLTKKDFDSVRDKKDLGYWLCPFCGQKKVDDENGLPRICHLNDVHPNSLPSLSDLGCPSSWNRRFVWDHLLIALSGLIRGKSWPNHKRYFCGTSIEKQLKEHFAKQNAGIFKYEGPCNLYSDIPSQRIVLRLL